MFYIYREADGALVSSTADGAAVPKDLAERGLAVVELDRPEAGSRWNPATLAFDPPEVREITAYQFLLRFTVAERAGIMASPDPVVAQFLKLLEIAAASGVLVDLDGARTVEGLAYLVDTGVLDGARADEIRA
jgi:hypothetical protein